MQIGVKSEKTESELSWDEEIIKAQLGQWIDDANKKAELDQRLQTVFQNSKSHIQNMS